MSIWHEPQPTLEALNARDKGSMGDFLGIELVARGDDTLTARMPVNARTI